MKEYNNTIDSTIKEEKIDFNISISEFDMGISAIESEDELDPKTIKFIERQIRNSYEYRNYIKYLKEELDLTKCALIPSIDTKDINVSLEFHHFPFTLYDLSDIVARSMIDASDKPVSTIEVAEKVMQEHYENKVGLVPLTKTLHEMAHNNSVVIPLDKVNGNYKAFIQEYRQYIPEDLTDQIIIKEEYNNSESAKEFNKSKLKKRIVNYNIDYNNEGDDNV